MSANQRIQQAKDLFKKIADQVGIPSASEFKTEAAADAALGPKLASLETKFHAACGEAGLHPGDSWNLCAPSYLEAKGWRVTFEDAGLTVHTADVAK